MSSITSAHFSRFFLTPFYSQPMRFAGTSAGTFHLKLLRLTKRILRFKVVALTVSMKPLHFIFWDDIFAGRGKSSLHPPALNERAKRVIVQATRTGRFGN